MKKLVFILVAVFTALFFSFNVQAQSSPDKSPVKWEIKPGLILNVNGYIPFTKDSITGKREFSVQTPYIFLAVNLSKGNFSFQPFYSLDNSFGAYLKYSGLYLTGLRYYQDDGDIYLGLGYEFFCNDKKTQSIFIECGGYQSEDWSLGISVGAAWYLYPQKYKKGNVSTPLK